MRYRTYPLDAPLTVTGAVALLKGEAFRLLSDGYRLSFAVSGLLQTGSPTSGL